MGRNRLHFDVLIVGSGVSGSKIAQRLTERSGGTALDDSKIALLEAGQHFTSKTFPLFEADANSKLYWGGGMELTSDGGLALLRARCVGGGSIVNQALVERFDDAALAPWREKSGLDFFSPKALEPYYLRAESALSIQKIAPEHRNANAQIFSEGARKCDFNVAGLSRAQSQCDYASGADCMDCLFGCRRDSKQSTPITTLARALARGLHLYPQSVVHSIEPTPTHLVVNVLEGPSKRQRTFTTGRLVLAAGSLGNVKILKKSGLDKGLPHLGEDFFTHPQYMVLARYAKKVNAFRGAFQSMKSEDANFRREGFKLENVFGPPVALAMLMPGIGAEHHNLMRAVSHMACIEVAVRDTAPGKILVSDSGKITVIKKLNTEDTRRRDTGLKVVHEVFKQTGALQIIPGELPIGLHLMGGCCLGSDERHSVVNADFSLWNEPRIHIADSSVFPNAPGINPSLTIMALSEMAADKVTENVTKRVGGKPKWSVDSPAPAL